MGCVLPTFLWSLNWAGRIFFSIWCHTRFYETLWLPSISASPNVVCCQALIPHCARRYPECSHCRSVVLVHSGSCHRAGTGENRSPAVLRPVPSQLALHFSCLHWPFKAWAMELAVVEKLCFPGELLGLLHFTDWLSNSSNKLLVTFVSWEG